MRFVVLLSWSLVSAGSLLPVVLGGAAEEQRHESPAAPSEQAPCDACDALEEGDAKHLAPLPTLHAPAFALAGFESDPAAPRGTRQPPPPPPPPNA